MTIQYYNQHAASFDADTADVDMSALYSVFLPLLPKHAHIVDAGCGSGRDALAFAKHGFQVTAFDGSEALVKLAQERIAQAGVQVEVEHAMFDTFSVETPVEAIWACASLLHVPFAKLNQTFAHLALQLKAMGVFYCSFKYGDSETERAGRRFTNLNERLLMQVLDGTGLRIQTQWVTGDARPGREHEKWLNAILIRDET